MMGRDSEAENSRSWRRWAALALGVVAVGCAVGTVAGASMTVEALQVSLEVEQALLLQDVEGHERVVGRRAQVQVRLQNLYATLDHELRQPEIAIDEVEALVDQVEFSERELDQLIENQRLGIRRMLDRARRIRELETRAGLLRDQEEQRSGALAGTWEVSMLPGERRGVFRLEQNGVLVSGTYTLEGGWTGSLQGTLVNRKVYFVRIDSKLGRSMEFEGILSAEGNTVRGSWLNYDLGAEGGAEGQWSATRVED
jgi:hypothetical protein